MTSHPLGPDAPTEDHVGLAFGALGFSAAFGLSLNAVVTFVVRTLQAAEVPTEQLDIGSSSAVVLFTGTFLACFAAAIATWRITAPVQNAFRQGMLAMVSFFAAFVLSILTMPIDRGFGRAGLAVLAVATFALAMVIARRLGRTPAP